MPPFLASTAAPERADVKMRRCVSAGEALPADVGRRWSERYGVDILDGIGSTEMLHIFLSNRAGEVKYGTTGKPVPGYDVRLVDDDGHVVKSRGEMGELQVRGPTSAVMYWNNREQSRATFLGEWTRSGDKYVEDEDGYFVYCGRRDDMLKVGGIYVSPFEVEARAAKPSRRARSRRRRLAGRRQLIKPKAFVVLKSPEKAGDELARRCRIMPAKSSPPSNIRAGSSSAPNCRKPRPAKSSASSSGRRRRRSDLATCVNICWVLLPAIPSAGRGSSAGRAPHS